MEELKTEAQLIRKLRAVQQRIQKHESKLGVSDQSLPRENNRREGARDELAALQVVSAIVTTAQSENELLERVTQFIGPTFYSEGFGILLRDVASDTLYSYGGYRTDNDVDVVRHEIADLVARNGQLRNVSDVTQEPAYLEAELNFSSELCVPLRTGTQVIGIIQARSRQIYAFDGDDEQFLTILAGQLATGIEKMQLFGQIVGARRREQQISEISRLLGLAQDLPTILANVVRMTAEMIGANAGLLGLVIDNQIITYYPYNVPHQINLRPSPKGQGPAWQIVETGESTMLPHYQDHPRSLIPWVKADAQAFIGVPIAAGEVLPGHAGAVSLAYQPAVYSARFILVEAIGRQAGMGYPKCASVRRSARARWRVGGGTGQARGIGRQQGSVCGECLSRITHTSGHYFRVCRGHGRGGLGRPGFVTGGGCSNYCQPRPVC